uniref:CUB domain-containing protein n=1 Tax=Ditylenchus dipsaci TaxID=166011 RepID=A0A915DJT3_9BILA
MYCPRSNGSLPQWRVCPSHTLHRCICPSGYGSADCSTFEAPKSGRDCGGIVDVESPVEWRHIRSPGYATSDGYAENQVCNWIVRAVQQDNRQRLRVELEFVDDFSFLCSSTCLDYVEIKLGKDQRATGSRFCCDQKPEKPLVSDFGQVAVIFHSQAGRDLGFHLRVRATLTPSTTFQSRKPGVIPRTKTQHLAQLFLSCLTNGVTGVSGVNVPKVVALVALDLVSVIVYLLNAIFEDDQLYFRDKDQEFSACKFEACPVHANCADRKLLYLNRLCKRDTSPSAIVCSQLSETLAECHKPSCCPPFYSRDGKCVTEQFDQTEAIGGGHVAELSISI